MVGRDDSSVPIADRLHQRLDAGDVAIGSFVRYADASLAEFLALCGLDFLVFDAEHGSMSPHQGEHLIRAAELHGVTPLVRLAENDPTAWLRYLDAGALGCHVPSVETALDAANAVMNARFQPYGRRGLAASRASGFGPIDGYARYIERAEAATRIVVHIESARGLDAAGEIAAVDGIDVLLLGPLDLSNDLGIPGEVEDEQILAAGQRLLAVADDTGKVFGAVANDERSAAEWVKRGARYLVFPVEAFMRSSIKAFIAAAREQG